jgi:hypothetical protein
MKMHVVKTPRGELAVTATAVANAADRVWRLGQERRVGVADKARRALDRNDSRRAAATVAACA